MLQPIEAKSLASLPGIRHGFFTRIGGVSEGLYASLNCGPGSADAPANVAENRARVARHLGGRHPDVATIYQVHSGDAVAIDAPVDPGARPKADAIVTRTPGLVIGILTADCAPVLFADPDGRRRRCRARRLARRRGRRPRGHGRGDGGTRCGAPAYCRGNRSGH